ncbi:MAG: nucleoside-diphosphate kinase [Syntrophomonadaceae bacterium]|nr:nucleoside-diphosphate kinase [Syntrophomonadaceae bacterium]
MEQTYVMVKPDGVQRNLVGEIVSRFEKKGLKIVGLKMLQITRELAERHYEEHRGRLFSESLVEYIISSPVVAIALEGKDAVDKVREMMGATNPLTAAPGTIRGDFGMDIGRNIVHSSDSLASAARELDLFFVPGEIVDYRKELDSWIYE